MIDDIIKSAAGVQRGISGIKAAFPDARSSISQFPAFINYPGKGDLQWPRKPSVRQITHDINMDLLVQEGGDLSSADRLLKPYLNRVMETFDQHITLGATCLNSGVVSYNYGQIEYAGIKYLGIKFTLRAVELTQVVYHS